MVNAYIENSYKLVFPLLCDGYLNLNYDDVVTHPATVESTGVLVNNGSGYSDNASTTIAVDTVDATTKFAVGDTVYDDAGVSVGVITVITATLITLAVANTEPLADDENLKKNITTTESLRNRGIWAHNDSFTIEALITPYDVNGIGSRTAGRHGVLTSAKTPPYPSDAYSSRASTYESVSVLGASNYLTQKLMLFHNQYVKFYLQNTTSSSYNQPAEYKVVAELTESGGSTKTITSDTVITAVDTLHGSYDASGYYADRTTSYQRVSAAATGSNPTGTVTIQDYDDLESNVAATGQIVIDGDNNLAQMSNSTIDTVIGNWLRKTAAHSGDGYKITYDAATSGGNTRGTAMLDTKLNGSGNYLTRQVSDDYRSQEMPNGSAATVTTYNLRIAKG